MTITLESAPATVQRVHAWTVSLDDGPFFFFGPGRTRAWGYFTKQVADQVAAALKGFADPTTTSTVKDVVTALPEQWQSGALS